MISKKISLRSPFPFIRGYAASVRVARCVLKKEFPALNTISTKSLNLLPDISQLKKLMQSLSILDAIMSPEWSDRFYSFNSKWGECEQMGSMRNGCGDDFSILFNSSGCFIKGFDHESAMSSWGTDGQLPWENLLKGLPPEFLSASKEPAFSMDDISFCIWRLSTANSWSKGEFEYADDDDPDGSEHLLDIFDAKPITYQVFAQEYYEVDLAHDAIEKIYHHIPLTNELIQSINPEITLKELEKDIMEIGYPSTNAI
ncbi:MAG: hypothetical protein V7765_07415 [Oleispira sp.]